MNRKMVFLMVLVLVVLAFALFNPHSISATGPKQYKVISGDHKGDFEKEVSTALNEGWSCVGGVSAPRGSYSYMQALVK